MLERRKLVYTLVAGIATISASCSRSPLPSRETPWCVVKDPRIDSYGESEDKDRMYGNAQMIAAMMRELEGHLEQLDPRGDFNQRAEVQIKKYGNRLSNCGAEAFQSAEQMLEEGGWMPPASPDNRSDNRRMFERIRENALQQNR